MLYKFKDIEFFKVIGGNGPIFKRAVTKGLNKVVKNVTFMAA
jgi:hypothetical protein